MFRYILPGITEIVGSLFKYIYLTMGNYGNVKLLKTVNIEYSETHFKKIHCTELSHKMYFLFISNR